MPIVGSSDSEKARISNAASALNDCPIVDVAVWSEYGQEHYHPDVGEYWKPAHIKVKADMSDMTVLTVLSNVMDKYGLKVHVHHGIKESGDDWARLVVDRSGGDA